MAVSPADGKVVKIERMEDPISGETRLCVCVFMNVFNVHVNRTPVAGTITAIKYYAGKFFNASLDKAPRTTSAAPTRLKMRMAIPGPLCRSLALWQGALSAARTLATPSKGASVSA